MPSLRISNTFRGLLIGQMLAAASGLRGDSPVAHAARAWPAARIKVGRPWTKAKTRNRTRNKIARASRRANRSN